MVRRRSKVEMWVPGAYLALVVGMLAYCAIGQAAGADLGFFGIWPILASAPAGLLLTAVFTPAPDLGEPAPPVDGYRGSEPPAEPPTEFFPPTDPLPADWAPDTSVADKLPAGEALGFYGPVLVGALVNAAAMWALIRYVAQRRAAGRAPAHIAWS
ncbi:hypothetical protein [Kitasatospora sp. NPDC002040]|uniref:SCO4225 family membrane protein n=1 Tax=Kitasatospora sp. NPDC002040 TaxID=3154661 RepID=UPI0033242A79